MATALERGDEQHERDMDALHILPLSIIPFINPGVRQARLIKNYRLESVIELFRDRVSGSLQADPSGLDKIFRWGKEEHVRVDMELAKSLAALNSYDVYCLRIDLRRLGINVDQDKHLQLSKAKQEELTDYMRAFTAPLIKRVYGADGIEIDDWDQLLGLFTDPDRETAIANLRELARTLEIEMVAVPAFLEDYADIFLSLAFYRQCLDKLVPRITNFLGFIENLNTNYQLSQDKVLMDVCHSLGGRLNDVTSRVTGRFESFDEHSRRLWKDLSAESFGKFKKLIESHHTTVGGVLCGLSVKMDIWDDASGHGSYGPVRQAEFIMSHMRGGMERIEQIEKAGPSQIGLQS